MRNLLALNGCSASVEIIGITHCDLLCSEVVMESLERFVMLATSNDITRAAIDHGHVSHGTLLAAAAQFSMAQRHPAEIANLLQ
jgi:hypothetical protein